MIRRDRFTYCVAAILLILAGALLLPVQNVTMLVNVLLLTGILCREKKKIRQTFYKCLTVIFFIWYETATIASMVMVIAPCWHDSAGYNYFMGAAVLLLSVSVKMNRSLIHWFYNKEDTGFSVLIQMLVLCFFSFILTRYYGVIAAESKRQWGVFCLSFLLLLLIVSALQKRMYDLSLERRQLALRMEQQQEAVRQVQGQFETMVTLKHYYTNLFYSLMPYVRDNDMEGLREYFTAYIYPIHQKHIESSCSLEKIHSPIIRNLIDIALGQAAALDGVAADLSINGSINLPNGMELVLFEILSNLLDNAFAELDGQSGGLLRIEISSAEAVSLLIANTLQKNVNIEQLYKQKRERSGNHGYGLNRVREIVLQHQGIEHYTYKSGEYKGREILVQHIRIMQEGGLVDS